MTEKRIRRHLRDGMQDSARTVTHLLGGALLAGGVVWGLMKLLSTRSSLGAAGGAIRGIQTDLRKIGVPVRASGVLDEDTVNAINNIFEGSVDVPPALRSGQLTATQIVRQLGAVSKALKRVVRGAMTFEDVSA